MFNNGMNRFIVLVAARMRIIVLIGSFIVNEAAGMASMHSLVPTYFTG